jgi:hypothetical protein
LFSNYSNVNFPSIPFDIFLHSSKKWWHQTFPSMLEIVNIVFPIILFPYHGNTTHLVALISSMCVAIVHGVVQFASIVLALLALNA